MYRILLVFLLLIIASTFFVSCQWLQKPSYSGLQIITKDQPSSVFLDGNYINKSPLIEKRLLPGVYTLKIEPDNPNLIPYETTITLRPQVLTTVTWKNGTRPELSGGVILEMEKIASRNKSELSLITIPDNAIIQLEGREKDSSPVVYTKIEPGNYDLEIVLPSYEVQKHTLSFLPGFRLIALVKLAKLPDSLSASQSEEEKFTTLNATDSAIIISEEITSATASARPIAVPYVRIRSTNFFQNGVESLRVRSGPNITSESLGYTEVGKYYPYLNKTDSNWHEIAFEEGRGWVSGDFTDLITN